MFYPEELVEEVRERNDIVSVIGSYVKLKKTGANYVGLCPFHNEKSPSFSVSGSKQMYYCFGCGVGGNVYTFLMEYENYTFVEALKALADRAGVKLPELEYSQEEKRQADRRSRLYEINKLAAKYYYCQLRDEKRGSMAYQYLKRRGLSDETITHFGLGASSKSGGDLYRYLRSKGYDDEILSQTGLITMDERRGAYDKFWNRVIFPIMDANSKVIGFGGRVMGEGTPKYLNSPETMVFDKSRNLYGLNFARQTRKNYMIICEGYMDVIALHQAGFTNAVASLGTAFTGLQAALLARYTKEVFLTYDSDEAGTKAALRAIPILKEAGLTARVINMKPYKDPDEFIKALGAEEFENRIKQAGNSFYFEIEVLERQFDLTDPEQKTKFFNETAKKLLVFTEELERNNYIEAIARRYNVGYESLRKLVNRYGAMQSVVKTDTERPVRQENGKKDRADEGMRTSQKLLLTWLINDNRQFEAIRGIIGPEDFTEEFYREVAGMVFEQYETKRTVIPAGIISRFENKEEQTMAAELFSTELSGELGSTEQEKAFAETVRRIKKNSLDLASRKAAEAGDGQALQKIIMEQANLQKLHISLKNG
ncbi:MAG: DNA primase [Lachnospiraceae bacterium]|nr:DNA primase [Lachnospiraceae bacterium]